MMAAQMQPAAPLLECSQLTVHIGERRLVSKLDLQVARGSFTCVLGCNGSGKTTTLHTLAGVRACSMGDINVLGRRLEAWPRKVLARHVGLLTQDSEDSFPSTVLESVLVGRHPHIGFWRWEGETDRRIARDALRAVGLDGLDDRDVTTLSGGERRRVAVASMLTQDPQLALLDEPTNHLDPHHQMEVLRLFRERTGQGCAVVATLHDAGLAARFADQVLLLFGNGDWACGSVAQVLTVANLSRLYGMPMRELAWEGGRTFVADQPGAESARGR
jgi:iron complex transport system ATP-binding protein